MDCQLSYLKKQLDDAFSVFKDINLIPSNGELKTILDRAVEFGEIEDFGNVYCDTEYKDCNFWITVNGEMVDVRLDEDKGFVFDCNVLQEAKGFQSLKKLIKEEVEKLHKKKQLLEQKRILETELQQLDETGEWNSHVNLDYVEENPDDESEEALWIQQLKKQLENVKSLLNNPEDLEIENIRGFDKYQGPYADILIKGKHYTAWTAEDNMLYIEDLTEDNEPKSEYEIAEYINNLND